MVTKNFHTVTLLAIDVRHVNHTDIHADIPYIGCPLAVYKTIGMSISKMAVQAVGVTDGKSRYTRRTGEMPFPAIPHRILFGNITYLEMVVFNVLTLFIMELSMGLTP